MLRHDDRLTFSGEESPNTPIAIWSQVAGNTRRVINDIEVRAVTPGAKANGFLRE